MIHKSIQSALVNLYFFTQIAIKQSVKALTKPRAQASAKISAVKRASDQASPTKSLSYIINCVGFGLALLLSACTYNGLSGSSGGDDTTAINGLWIQQEQATLTGAGKNCGCREFGSPSGRPRRCYSYFADGVVVSGYLTAAADASNCATEFTLNPDDRAEFNRVLSDLAQTARNMASISSFGQVVFSYAVGTFTGQSSDATVTGSGPSTGEYFNIRYLEPAAGLARRGIICTSYAPRDANLLYLAGDPSGGGQPQTQDPTACNDERFTNLIRYEKVNP